MKKTILFCMFLIVALFIAGCKTSPHVISTSKTLNDNEVMEAKMENGVQTATLSWGQLNYQPSTIKLKEGVKARITADTDRLQGCYASIVIPEFNVDKAFTKNDNTVEFMPDKKGTFNFACGMGMGRGTLVVE